MFGALRVKTLKIFSTSSKFLIKNDGVLMNVMLYRISQVSRNELQSTLVISKSKGPSKTLRDIRNSTYQICSIEEKTIRTTKFHK